MLGNCEWLASVFCKFFFLESLGCSFDGRLGGSKGQSACGGEEKILAPRGEAKHVCAAVVSHFP